MNGEKVILTAPELQKVLQTYYRAFVTGVRFVVEPTGEVALEVHFAQQNLSLRVASDRR